MTTENLSDNLNCNRLLGLYFTSPDCIQDKYIHAYSFHTNILQNLIELNSSVSEKEYYSIEPVKFYQYLYVVKSDSVDTFFGKKNVNGLIGQNENIKFKEAQNNIYGYYRIDKQTNQEEQVLLLCKNKENFIKNSNISLNPVIIDTFYEEGIMNA
jgi:hypothetical protein